MDSRVRGRTRIPHDDDVGVTRPVPLDLEVLDRITDGVFVLDRDWTCVFMNEAGGRLVGHHPAHLIGRNIWEAFPDAVGSIFEQRYRWALDHQEVVEFEEYFVPLDKWLSVRVFPCPDGLTITYQDSSVRRFAEDALRQSVVHAQTAQTSYQDLRRPGLPPEEPRRRPSAVAGHPPRRRTQGSGASPAPPGAARPADRTGQPFALRRPAPGPLDPARNDATVAHWVALPVAVAALGVVAALWTVLIGSADPDGTHSVAQAVVGPPSSRRWWPPGSASPSDWPTAPPGPAARPSRKWSAAMLAEATLQASEERLFQFLDAIPVGVFIASAGGKPFYVNVEGRCLLGRGLAPGVGNDHLTSPTGGTPTSST